MRLVALLLQASLALALTSCVLAGSRRVTERPDEAKSPSEAIQQALGALSGTGSTRTPPAAALDDLETHEPTAEGDEREEIRVLIPILAKVADTGESLTADDYRAAHGVMERVARTRTKDFEVQYAMVAGMVAMETALKALGVPEAATGESRAKDLAERFPGQARAHAHLGNVLSETDELLAMRSFARCLRLDPGLIGCKTSLKTTAARYRAPRCTAVGAKKLALHPAYEPNATTARAGRKGLRPIKVEKRQLLMEAKPALDGTAIEEATQQHSDVTLSLSPRAAATLAEVTAKLAERRAYLAVLVDGKVHAAPQVMSPIETGVLTVNGVELRKICTKLETRPLPKDVAGLVD